jgi:hypothetical protein
MTVRATFRQLGAVDGALYFASRAFDKISGGRLRLVKYYLVAQPLGRPDAKPMRADAATALQVVREGDALAAVFPRPPDVLAQRWAAGAECTAALVRGEFAGFIWIQRSRYEEDEVRCSFVLQDPAVSVWDYDVYVEPRYRVGRTMARLWSHVDTQLAATGARWSFSRISAFNAASLGSHARLGTVDCGSALFLCLGPLQAAWVPGFPYLHLSLGAGRAPVVRLRTPT